MKLFKSKSENDSNIISSTRKWVLEFSKTLITSITIVYFLNNLIEIILILLAIYKTGAFSYLDTFIIETNNTFRDIICVNLFKCIIENVFKYNDFGGRIVSKSINEEESEDENMYGN